MRVYTVHLHRPTLDPERDVVFVKEGFSWPAAIFGVLWALWRGLWTVAAGLLLVEIGVTLLLEGLAADPATSLVVVLGFAVLVGLLGNDLVRWTLFRRGFLEIGVVTGEAADLAERRFWDQRPQLAAELTR